MRFHLAAICMLMAGHANALSCVAPDPVHALVKASESEDVYVVVHGSMTLTSEPVELGRATHGRQLGARGTAFIEGESLTRQGFATPFFAEVSIWTDCEAQFCGTIPEEGSALMFLKRDRGIYVLEPTACQTAHFSDPTSEDLIRVASCFAQGECDTSGAQ